MLFSQDQYQLISLDMSFEPQAQLCQRNDRTDGMMAVKTLASCLVPKGQMPFTNAPEIMPGARMPIDLCVVDRAAFELSHMPGGSLA